jgi:hypothetical protein
MGLDQYAYLANKADEDWENHQEIAYWRKHPNLQGWMEKLWLRKLEEKGETVELDEFGSKFNGIELELTWQDIEELERDVKKHKLPKTSGFFFGDDADQHYYQQDLDFIKRAKAELFCGLKVFYNSSW